MISKTKLKKVESIDIGEILEEQKNPAKNLIHAVNQEDMLVLYFIKVSKFTYVAQRMFIDGEDWIIEDFKTGKFRTACLGNFLWRESIALSEYNIETHRYESNNIVTAQSKYEIEKYYNKKFKNVHDAIYHIKDEQYKILDKKLEAKYIKITSKIDAKMKDVKEKPPKSFLKWIDQEVFKEHRYIFYNRKNPNPKKGHCSHCNSDVFVGKDVRHNDEGICPNCKSKIIYKASGKATSIITEKKYNILLIQKVKNVEEKTELVFRYFEAWKDFRFKREEYYPKQPTLIAYETSRVFLLDGKVDEYYFGDFRQTGKHRWCNGEANSYLWHEDILYTKNLDSELKNTAYKYCQIKTFYERNEIKYPPIKFNAVMYMQTYEENPILEYLVKLNLNKLACSLVKGRLEDILNKNGNTFTEILQVDKKYLNIMIRNDADEEMLKILQEAFKRNINLKDKEILKIRCDYSVEIIELLNYTTITKITNYIEKNSQDGREFYRDYIDYFRDCKELEYDLNNDFVLFPKNFYRVHEETWKLNQSNNKQENNEQLNEVFKEIKKLEFKYKDLCIIAPEDAKDITFEGHKLRHCVGNYINRIAKRETIIMFIRNINEIEKPYYTLEISYTGEIIQCRGYMNKDTNDEIKEFLEKFKEAKFNNENNKKKFKHAS